MILQYIEENMVLTILHHIFKPKFLNEFNLLSKLNLFDLLHKNHNDIFEGKLVDLFTKKINGLSLKELFKSSDKFDEFLERIHHKILDDQGRYIENGKINIKSVFSLIRDQIDNAKSAVDHITDSNATTANDLMHQVFNPFEHFHNNHSNIINGAGAGAASLIGIPIISKVVNFDSPSKSEAYPLPSADLSSDLLPSMVKGAALLGGSYAAYKYLKSRRDDQRIHP